LIWTSTQTTIPTPAYPCLRIRIEQSGDRLGGAFRDEVSNVDVLVSSGRIDNSGNVDLTVVLTDADRLKQVLIFQGQLVQSGDRRQIAGTYLGIHPRESGSFTMTHD
jgi:hypothetical protein